MGTIAPANIEFTTMSGVEEARELMISALIKNGATMKIESTTDIVASFGSALKMRLLGAILVGIKTFPRDVVIVISSDRERTRIKARVSDTFGFGSRIGIEDKVQSMMYEDGLKLKSLFGDSKT